MLHVINKKKILKKIESEIESYENISIERIDVDDQPAKTSKFQVHSIPTVIILDDDEIHRRFVGVTQKSTLLDALGDFL